MNLLAVRWSKKLEAEGVLCEYREAARTLSMPETDPKRSSKTEILDWKQITPEPLILAVTHIRESFDTAVWKFSKVTQKFCYAALHPKEIDPASLAPYQDAFAVYREIIGSKAVKRFNELCQTGTPPALFKAFFDILLSGLKVEVRREFDELVEIGRMNATTFSLHHVEWAKLQLQIVIRSEEHGVKRWIKEVCDNQDLADSKTDEDFDELLFWKKWRAPRLVHMKPSGNTIYDQTTEWTRENEQRTQGLLNSFSQNLLGFLEIELNHAVGEAYVNFAKKEGATVVQKHENQRFVSPAVTQLPPPPAILQGLSFSPRGPEPTQPLLNFPAYYPNHLHPMTWVVIGEAVKKFPVQTEMLALLRFVISGLTPYYSAAVEEKILRPDLALGAMGDLIHSLSVHNSDRHSDTFRLEQEARKSDEWLGFAKQIAAGGAVMAGEPGNTAAGKVAKVTSQSNNPEATSWDGVEILFTSEERVQLRINGAISSTLNYSEFGFEDSRNGKPNRAWEILRKLAELRGTIRSSAETCQPWPKIEKRIQDIRRVLRTHFRISSDPIPYVDGTGYRARFKIACRPSYDT
jgi:hypothetical protein